MLYYVLLYFKSVFIKFEYLSSLCDRNDLEFELKVLIMVGENGLIVVFY